MTTGLLKTKTEFVAASLIECEYLAKKQIFQEVVKVLEKLPTLSPCEEPFVPNDGVTQRLLGLKGTIPTEYQGNSYNTPISIWIPKEYPNSQPIIYVCPARGMRIRVSKYVDRNGGVRVPVSLPIRFSLEVLVQFLTTIFGENPPLYIKKRKRSYNSREGSLEINPEHSF